VPAPYFVQLVGLALGIQPSTLAIDRQMVGLKSVLGKAGVLR
jgi:heterodisulfide reductase subunit B